MKVIGFDERTRNWNISKHVVAKNDPRRRSNLHIRARKILQNLFPYDTILEEVSLPGSNKPSRRSVLYADFFIPQRRLVVEVHGRQHYEHISHFHPTKAAFYKARGRDKDKIRWCGINSIDIVILKYSNSDEEWKQSILDR
ncbi:hypothetical protein CL634_07695 [bacterium]|nr:hypothetical protein [bacterium]